jgi:transposase
MPILADLVDIVVGVDTHKKTHTAAVVSAAGAVITTTTVIADPAGFDELLATVQLSAGRRVWAIEGCGSWGRGLTRWLILRAERVIEVDRPHRSKRRHGIKTDTVDAVRAAREALAGEHHADPRADGLRDAIAAAHLVRRSAVEAAKVSGQQLCALANTAPEALAVQLRGLSTLRTTKICAGWQPTSFDDPIIAAIGELMTSLARRAQSLRDEAAAHKRTLHTLINQWRPDLLTQPGVGPETAAVVLAAWSHPGRVRTPGAFARIAGCAPIPVSSGNTDRTRLNRSGDRDLNRAIHTIALTRMRCDERTRTYVARRRAEGKPLRDIRRCLKTYIARELFTLLEQPLDRT